MPVEVKMPQMGESITEGTIVKWHKQPGEKVRRDEVLFEISTDKVDTEVPSPAEGWVAETYVAEGETVAVHTPVCLLTEEEPAEGRSVRPPAARETSGGAPQEAAESGAGAPADRPRPSEPATAEAEPPRERPSPREAREERRKLSPAVRKLLREHDVDLGEIEGTGAGGRISRNDVLRYLERRGERPAARRPAPAALEDRTEPLSVMRQRIAAHMVESKRTSPHVYTVHEADLTPVARLRRELAEKWKAQGVKPTYLAFITQAVGAALREFPVINASLEGDTVHYHGDVNIGVAVALESGLVVPVIRQADRLSVLELARAIQDLATRARTKKLRPEETRGGTFTITNPGVFGSIMGLPIINQPQSAILCLGAVKKRVVVLPGDDDADAFAVRSLSWLTLSFDHRLIDGATADRFVAAVTAALEGGDFRTDS